MGVHGCSQCTLLQCFIFDWHVVLWYQHGIDEARKLTAGYSKTVKRGLNSLKDGGSDAQGVWCTVSTGLLCALVGWEGRPRLTH